MTPDHSQQLNDEEAEKFKAKALELARELEIEKKINYLLVHGPAREIEHGKQMALPGSGYIILVNQAEDLGFKTRVIHAHDYNVVYQSKNGGEEIEIFRNGQWTNALNFHYKAIKWEADNPVAAKIMNNFGVIDDG